LLEAIASIIFFSHFLVRSLLRQWSSRCPSSCGR